MMLWDVVFVFVCVFQSGYTSRDPGIRLLSNDACAPSWHHGEGRVCLGNGLPVLRTHLSLVL